MFASSIYRRDNRSKLNVAFRIESEGFCVLPR